MLERGAWAGTNLTRVSRSALIALGILGALLFGATLTVQPLLPVLAVGGVVAWSAPSWTLAAGAILSQRLLPEVTPLASLGGGAFLVSDLFFFVLVGRWAVQRLTVADRRHLAWCEGHLWLLLFFAWAWFSVVLNQSWPTAGALARVTLYGAGFVAMSTESRRQSALFHFVAFAAAAETLLTLAGVTPTVGVRALGLYGDPGVFGVLMLAGLAGSLTLGRGARFLVSPLILAGLALSVTRGIWVAAAVGLSILVIPRITRRTLRTIALVAVLLSVALWALPLITSSLQLNPESATLRLESWRSAISLIQTQPLLGIGWGGGELFGSVFATTPYNLWLNVAATTGIPGAMLLSAWLFGVYRRLSKNAEPEHRAALIYLVEMLVFSLASMILFAGSSTAIEFFLLVGAGLAGLPPPEQQRSLSTEKGLPVPIGS